MIRKTRLFTPGPTPLLPAAQFAMWPPWPTSITAPPNSVRFTPAYLAHLKELVGTTNDVVILSSSSSTGAMEACSLEPSPRPAIASSSSLAGQIRRTLVWPLAKAFGCHVDAVSAPMATFSLDEVKASLHLETRAVFMQATETPPASATAFPPSPSCSRTPTSKLFSSSTPSPASAPCTSIWIRGSE